MIIPADAQNIYLIRHGETSFNRGDVCQGSRINPPLNEFGIRQIEQLACSLKEKIDLPSAHPRALPAPHYFVSSPMIRARQSGEIILNTLQDVLWPKPKLQIFEDLIEIDHGAWEGMHIPEIEREYPNEYQQWKKNFLRFQYPDGDVVQIKKRSVLQAMRNVVRDAQGRHIVATLHGGVIHLILSYVLESTNTQRFVMRNSGLSIIQCRGSTKNPLRESRVITLNSTDHLND